MGICELLLVSLQRVAEVSKYCQGAEIRYVWSLPLLASL